MIEPFLPMLATSALPFDSEDYGFEVKWDGVRALAAVEGARWRLWGRALANYDGRYPELEVLRRFPAGTVVDGELVRFRDQRADLSSILRRHQMVHPDRIRHASRHEPVRYVLFDILYHQGKSLLQEPWSLRRDVLAELVTKIDAPQLIFSTETAEGGMDFFQRMVVLGHEGIMAKQQASRYLPGRRCTAWKKIKPSEMLLCVIIGYTPGREGIHRLLVASAHQGPLRYLGQVTCGFSDPIKAELARRLAARRRPRPVVACPQQALWVEPDLYCRVRFQHWTPRGRLRGASFAGMLEDAKT